MTFIVFLVDWLAFDAFGKWLGGTPTMLGRLGPARGKRANGPWFRDGTAAGVVREAFIVSGGGMESRFSLNRVTRRRYDMRHGKAHRSFQMS